MGGGKQGAARSRHPAASPRHAGRGRARRLPRETASSARDRPPQRSASSDPSANRGGIIQRESNNSVRFHTTRVKLGHSAMLAQCPVSAKPDTAGQFYDYTPQTHTPDPAPTSTPPPAPTRPPL